MGCICRRGHSRGGLKWPWMATPERAARHDRSGSDLAGEVDLVAAAEIDCSGIRRRKSRCDPCRDRFSNSMPTRGVAPRQARGSTPGYKLRSLPGSWNCIR